MSLGDYSMTSHESLGAQQGILEEGLWWIGGITALATPMKLKVENFAQKERI